MAIRIIIDVAIVRVVSIIVIAVARAVSISVICVLTNIIHPTPLPNPTPIVTTTPTPINPAPSRIPSPRIDRILLIGNHSFMTMRTPKTNRMGSRDGSGEEI